MKKTHQIITVLVAVVTLLTGCTKTENSVNKALKQGEATMNRIMDFKIQMEEAKTNPEMKSVVYMSIADALWNVEALFNLTYAYPEDSYGRTITCDTTLCLPVSSNDSVSINDLTVFYSQMFDAVQVIYQSIDIDDKQFIILDVEAGERNGGLQAINLHTVQGSVKGEPQDPHPWQLPEYFEEGSPWYYGEDYGRLDGTFWGVMDAADTLSRMLNANLVQKAPGGLIYIYTNIIMKELADGDYQEYSNNSYPGCGQYCEFYKENPSGIDFWLDADHMNFYYYGERHLVKNVLRTYGNNLVPSTHYLVNITINDHSQSSKIWHHTQATYGHREGLGRNEIVKGNL